MEGKTPTKNCFHYKTYRANEREDVCRDSPKMIGKVRGTPSFKQTFTVTIPSDSLTLMDGIWNAIITEKKMDQFYITGSKKCSFFYGKYFMQTRVQSNAITCLPTYHNCPISFLQHNTFHYHCIPITKINITKSINVSVARRCILLTKSECTSNS